MKRMHAVVPVLVLVLLGSFTSQASAMSLEAYGAYGGHSEGNYVKEGVNIVFFEGKRIDLFVGGETASIDTYATSIYPRSLLNGQNLDYTLKVNAATVGMRWKFHTESRWTPYLLAGFVYGTADYKIATNNLPGITYSATSASTDIRSFRGGFGTDVALSEHWGLGFEINYTIGPPTFDLTMTQTGSGTTEAISLPNTPEKGMLDFMQFRLKYAF